MKRILLCMIVLSSAFFVNAQPPAGDALVGDQYGDAITAEGAIKGKKLVPKLQNGEVLETKFTGKVLEVCPKKGCWIKLDLGKNSVATVKMKNYGFFVPTALEGKTIVIEGKAEYVTTSVDDLKHLAEDAKKSQAEIDAITEPKKEIKILANGITVVK